MSETPTSPGDSNQQQDRLRRMARDVYRARIHRMDSISLIELALRIGVTPSFQDGASLSIKDAYVDLKLLLVRFLTDKPDAQAIFDQYEVDYETYEQPLKKLLAEADAYKESSLL